MSGEAWTVGEAIPAWFAGGMTAHKPDDVVDAVVNLTYRNDRAALAAVRERRLHAKPDLT